MRDCGHGKFLFLLYPLVSMNFFKHIRQFLPRLQRSKKNHPELDGLFVGWVDSGL
jgi:hypothetical protein